MYMSSEASTSSRLSPSFSHIALGRQQGKSSPESSPLATPRLSQSGEIQLAKGKDNAIELCIDTWLCCRKAAALSDCTDSSRYCSKPLPGCEVCRE